MSAKNFHKVRQMLFLLISLGIFLPGAVSAEELCRACPFDCRGIGAGPKHCRDNGFHYGQCCVDLDKKGRKQLSEKDYENSQRASYHQEHYHYGPERDGYNRGQYGWGQNDWGNGYGRSHGDRPGEIQGDCPNGYHWNDRNCNDNERRNGCSDLRSPSGRICVGWRR